MIQIIRLNLDIIQLVTEFTGLKMIELLNTHRNHQVELDKIAKHIFALAISQDHIDTIDYNLRPHNASFGEINGSHIELFVEYHPTNTWDDFDEYKSMSIYLPLELFDDMSDDKFTKWFDTYFKAKELQAYKDKLVRCFNTLFDVDTIPFIKEALSLVADMDNVHDMYNIRDDLIEKYTLTYKYVEPEIYEGPMEDDNEHF